MACIKHSWTHFICVRLSMPNEYSAALCFRLIWWTIFSRSSQFGVRFFRAFFWCLSLLFSPSILQIICILCCSDVKIHTTPHTHTHNHTNQRFFFSLIPYTVRPYILSLWSECQLTIRSLYLPLTRIASHWTTGILNWFQFFFFVFFFHYLVAFGLGFCAFCFSVDVVHCFKYIQENEEEETDAYAFDWQSAVQYQIKSNVLTNIEYPEMVYICIWKSISSAEKSKLNRMTNIFRCIVAYSGHPHTVDSHCERVSN